MKVFPAPNLPDGWLRTTSYGSNSFPWVRAGGRSFGMGQFGFTATNLSWCPNVFLELDYFKVLRVDLPELPSGHPGPAVCAVVGNNRSLSLLRKLPQWRLIFFFFGHVYCVMKINTGSNLLNLVAVHDYQLLDCSARWSFPGPYSLFISLSWRAWACSHGNYFIPRMILQKGDESLSYHTGRAKHAYTQFLFHNRKLLTLLWQHFVSPLFRSRLSYLIFFKNQELFVKKVHFVRCAKDIFFDINTTARENGFYKSPSAFEADRLFASWDFLQAHFFPYRPALPALSGLNALLFLYRQSVAAGSQNKFFPVHLRHRASCRAHTREFF